MQAASRIVPFRRVQQAGTTREPGLRWSPRTQTECVDVIEVFARLIVRGAEPSVVPGGSRRARVEPVFPGCLQPDHVTPSLMSGDTRSRIENRKLRA